MKLIKEQFPQLALCYELQNNDENNLQKISFELFEIIRNKDEKNFEVSFIGFYRGN